MWTAITSYGKLLTLILECLSSHGDQFYMEQTSAQVAKDPVAIGFIVTIDVEAKLWTGAELAGCIDDAVAEVAQP